MVRAVGLAIAIALLLVAPASAASIPPVCPDGNFVTAPGTPLDLSAPTCTNLTGPPTLELVSPPSNGSLAPGPPVRYTPNPGFHNVDTFTYRVVDAVNGASQPATVRILVDRAPVCSPASVTVVMNTSTALPDVDCTDPDGDDFSIVVDDPAHGTIAIVNGQAIYTPPANFVGSDLLQFFGEDTFGLGGADTPMTITVIAPPPPPPPPPPAPQPAPRDTAAPSVTLSAKKATFTKGIPLTLGVNENASAVLTIGLDAKSARKYKLGRSVATLNAALTPGKASAITLKLSAKARKAFKKLKQMTVTVTAVVTDTAGNKTTKTLKVTIKQK
jgi:hypothetical protein